MSTPKVVALSLAAALLSAPIAITAHAATSTAPHATRHVAAATRHHAVKPVRSTTRAPRAARNSDNSADALNAQSLARSQGQQ